MLEQINNRFNSELETLTPENANSKILMLGNPSEILLNAGIEDKPLKLYGNKVMKKITKHGYKTSDLRDLPKFVADPLAIFTGNHPKSFVVLTEIEINGNNLLTALEIGKGGDIEFNIITSAYMKTKEQIKNWVNAEKVLYANKAKAPDYLRIPTALGVGAQNNQGLTCSH